MKPYDFFSNNGSSYDDIKKMAQTVHQILQDPNARVNIMRIEHSDSYYLHVFGEIPPEKIDEISATKKLHKAVRS
jgi:hypothetical protein